MTEQEKKILFQVICESLHYGLKCTTKARGWPGVYPICGCIGNKIILDCPKEVGGDDIWLVQNIVPYLRPLSSMTDREKEELKELTGGIIQYNNYGSVSTTVCGKGYPHYWCTELSDWAKVVDFLLRRHFDYRGLIPMGLALPAPEGMYK